MKWKDALHMIESIPGTFWGVVFGSFVSLTGVWLPEFKLLIGACKRS